MAPPPPTEQDAGPGLDNQRYHLIKQAKEMARILRDNATQCEEFADKLAAVSFSGLHALPSAVAPWTHMAGMIPAPVELNGASSPVDETGKKRKRRRGEGKEKKVRDPDLPKRPPSAYLLYQNEVRKDMQEKFKHLPYREVLGEIAKSWNAMSEEDKKMYQEATAVAKLQYTDAKSQYDRKHGIPEKPRKSVGPNAAAAAAPTPVADSPDADDDDSEEESSKPKSASSSDDSSDEEEATPAPPKKKAKDDKADKKKTKDKKRKD